MYNHKNGIPLDFSGGWIYNNSTSCSLESPRDASSLASSSEENTPRLIPLSQISRSKLVEEQRLKAQEQLLLYQQMVDAEAHLLTTRNFGVDFSAQDPNMSMRSSKNFIKQQHRNERNTSQPMEIPQTEIKTPNASTLTGFVFQVQFKAISRYYIYVASNYKPVNVGDFVVVEAERGQDLGVVTALLTTEQFAEKRQNGLSMSAENSRVRRIIRPATKAERQTLADKHKDEQSILQYCCQLAMTVHGLPISVHEAEYQFDKKKLTIYYDSATRVDFRELVRDLYAACKVRIWMEKINLKEEISKEAYIMLTTGAVL